MTGVVFVALALLVVWAPPANAQVPPIVPPVRWRVAAVHRPQGGAPAVLLLEGRIRPPWSIYSLTQPPGGPIATTVRIAGGAPLVLEGFVSGPAPIRTIDPNFGPVETYRERVVFRLRVRGAADSPSARNRPLLLVHYQACDGRLCLPPRTDTIPVPGAAEPQRGRREG